MTNDTTSTPHDEDNTTDFGFSRVNRSDKAGMVRGVFDSVAGRYDLMNDLMSGGIHRIWKRFTIELSAVRPGQTVLDIAGGTGDLAAKFSRLVGPEGQVILADINAAMLTVGRDRLIDKGATGNVQVVQADAQQLPFDDNSIDCITIAFGLRNVTDKAMAMRSMLRVLRPGGRVLVLEFSKPTSALLGQTIRSVFVSNITRDGPTDSTGCRKLSLFGRVYPSAPRSRNAAGNDGDGRVRQLPLPQYDRGRRRAPSRF